MFPQPAGIDQPRGLNLGALFGTEQALLKDPKRELAVQQSGIPFTIVRAGKIKSQPGSMMQLEISQNDQASGDIRYQICICALVAVVTVHDVCSIICVDCIIVFKCLCHYTSS